MKAFRLLLLLFAADPSAATITVTGTGDTIAVDGSCTLREALTAANTNAASGDCPGGMAGLDQIHFAIGGGGAQGIVIDDQLPEIIDPVTIDGTTQPGFAGTPLIHISGFLFNGIAMFVVPITGGGSTFRGLRLSTPLAGAAIELRSSGNIVAGNYFSTDGTMADFESSLNVDILGTVGAPASNNRIGGIAAADRNLFVGAITQGVAVSALPGAIADANAILGNYFGSNATKTAGLGAHSVSIDIANATNTTVIGNVLFLSALAGISIADASGTIVQSNEIGVLGIGSNRIGIVVQSGQNTLIGAATSGGPGGNTITGNGMLQPDTAGVRVVSATGTRISGNSMSFNGSAASPMGIDLDPVGPTPNDPCDPDVGANLLQNKPVLTSAVATNGTVLVEGTLNSTASAAYTIEIYANPPGFGDQGYLYLGAVSVTTDAGCHAQFTSTLTFVPPDADWTITATAIDAANNTSEMSGPATIVALDAPAVTKQFNPGTVTAGDPTRLTITLTNGNALAVTGAAFTDNYPVGLENALVPNVTNTCGGTVTAAPGGSTLILMGGSIPANGSCSVSVSVVPMTEGSFVNTLPAGSLTSSNAPPSGAAGSATLTAGAATADVPLTPTALTLLTVALATMGAMILRQMGGR